MMEGGSSGQGDKPGQFMKNAKKLADSLSSWRNYPSRLGSDSSDLLSTSGMTEGDTLSL